MKRNTLALIIGYFILWTALLLICTWTFRNYQFQKVRQDVAELKQTIGRIRGWTENNKQAFISKYGPGFNFPAPPKPVQPKVEKKVEE